MGVEDYNETKRRRHTPEQIGKLREADRMIGQGASIAEVLQHLEVTEATHYRWRNHYGAVSPDEARRLKELEVENARLKKLLAAPTVRWRRNRVHRTWGAVAFSPYNSWSQYE